MEQLLVRTNRGYETRMFRCISSRAKEYALAMLEETLKRTPADDHILCSSNFVGQREKRTLLRTNQIHEWLFKDVASLETIDIRWDSEGIPIIAGANFTGQDGVPVVWYKTRADAFPGREILGHEKQK